MRSLGIAFITMVFIACGESPETEGVAPSTDASDASGALDATSDSDSVEPDSSEGRLWSHRANRVHLHGPCGS